MGNSFESFQYGVDFIPDHEFRPMVMKLFDAMEKSYKELDPYRNVIDPFAALVEASSMRLTLDEWLELEKRRQANKALTNALGDFHQEAMGYLPGWENRGPGGRFDLIHTEVLSICGTPAVVELKNKYNTMNSGAADEVYKTFESLLRLPEYRNYTCFLAQVIQRSDSRSVCWHPGNRGKREEIRKIGAAQIYEEALGDPFAIEKVYKGMALVLGDYVGSSLEVTDGESVHELFRKAFKQLPWEPQDEGDNGTSVPLF